MKKGRKVKKMTNLLPFSYPNFEPTVSKDLIASNISQVYKVGKTIWGSLLGKDNKDLPTILLLNNVRFITFVEKTKDEFKKSYNDLHKFPKMDDEDWK